MYVFNFNSLMSSILICFFPVMSVSSFFLLNFYENAKTFFPPKVILQYFMGWYWFWPWLKVWVRVKAVSIRLYLQPLLMYCSAQCIWICFGTKSFHCSSLACFVHCSRKRKQFPSFCSSFLSSLINVPRWCESALFHCRGLICLFSIMQAIVAQTADLHCSPSSHRCNLMRRLTLCWQEEPEQWGVCICLAASSSNRFCFWTFSLLLRCPNDRDRILLKYKPKQKGKKNNPVTSWTVSGRCRSSTTMVSEDA